VRLVQLAILVLPEQEKPGQQGQPDILDIPAQLVLGIPAILGQLVTRETPVILETPEIPGIPVQPGQMDILELMGRRAILVLQGTRERRQP